MQIKNFKDMYVIELQELANMESQLDEALKRMPMRPRIQL